jgi:hypothetical protein
MTAQTVIAEIEALPASERAKVFAFVGEAMETDDAFEAAVPPVTAHSQAELEEMLLVAVEQLDRGERLPGEQVLAELEALGRQRRQAHG